MRFLVTLALCAAAVAGTAPLPAAAAETTFTVCPAGSRDPSCGFYGSEGLRQAADQSADGATVLLKPGSYAPDAVRDVRYGKLAIRGFLVIEGKRITLSGEPGAILDGATGRPASAIVVQNGSVTLLGVTVQNFRYEVEEDDIYDGHGLFVIDGTAMVRDVTFRNIVKMAITGRGDSSLWVDDVRMLDGHMGVWLEESSQLTLRNAVIRNNDSAAVGAYMQSQARVYNSIIDGSQDDGLYAKDDASIMATNTVLVRNKPIAVNATGRSKIWIGHSALYGNAKDVGGANVRLGPGVLKADPKLGPDDRPLPDSPLWGKGDPNVRTQGGSSTGIGLTVGQR